MIVLALIAALVGALAVAPASADRLRPPGKKAKKIKSQLDKRLKLRGLDNVDVRRCTFAKKKVRRKKAVLCTWYAEGTLPGEQPYRCHGDSLHGKLSDGRSGFIRISACVNKARVQIPLEPAPVHEPLFGYNEDFYTQTSLNLLPLYERLQPQFARFGLDWSVIESRRGSYDFSFYDRIYPQLVSRGIRPIWTLGAAPCFYQDNPCRQPGRPAPEHYDDMARFAAAVARHFPDIGAFEVLNEPNTAKYWGGIPEPDLYAELFIEVEKEVEKADPGLPVLFGSTSPHAEADADTVPAAEFVAQGYDKGAVQKSDGLALHPYPGTRPGESVAQGVAKRLGDIWEVMSLERDADRPMWITETGVSTHGDGAYSPAEQADALVEIYNTVRRIPQVPVLIIHRFRDTQGDNQFEPGYGSIDKDGNPKPAYCAIGATRGLTVC